MNENSEKWRAALLRLKPTLSWALEDGVLTAGTNWLRLIRPGQPTGSLRGIAEINQLRELIANGFDALERGDWGVVSATVGGWGFDFDKDGKVGLYFNQQLLTTRHHDQLDVELVAWIGLCVGNDSHPIEPADGYDRIVCERSGDEVLVMIVNEQEGLPGETKLDRGEARRLQHGLLALAGDPDNRLPGNEERISLSGVALIAGGPNQYSRLCLDGFSGNMIAVFSRIEAVCLAVELELILEQIDSPD